jgi:hypothetical protein
MPANQSRRFFAASCFAFFAALRSFGVFVEGFFTSRVDLRSLDIEKPP